VDHASAAVGRAPVDSSAPARTARPGTARVALAHDWLVGLRGGELLLDRLAQRYGPTDLYTLVSDGRPLTPAIDACRVVTSPLQRLPFSAGRLRRAYLPLYPWAVERLRVRDCDLLVSTSSAVIKSIVPPPGATHVCCCLSPARYIWEQAADYAVGRGARLRRLGLGLVGARMRRWDRATADRVDVFVAISRHTAARIERCYGRDAVIVHPPVRTELFRPDPSVPREGWFLVVAALEPYKRTDLVVEAANRAGFDLTVVGSGSQAAALAAAAGPTVEIRGRVDDEALRGLYRRAAALIFPQLEDFGIVAVEAQATGCPVIAFAGGGALDTVTGETGILFTDQSVDGIIEAVRAFTPRDGQAEACRANAERFSEGVFDEAFARVVRDALAGGRRRA
jgi:glycosyltransferase involved in cell wall biosynthesis